ncbi:hypothetical protein ACJIZ3_023837 [Penstemon smallii]|uniref:DUF4216 domain-containing protein n=1 Tax=Penstemon smallii TaxID=265156 RepID=A0ABD3TRJ9_9LAMI
MDEDTRTKAHQYVLTNCQAVEHYKEIIISQEYPHLSDWHRDNVHNKQFPSWFENQLTLDGNLLCEDLKALAQGPQKVYTSYKKFIVNGFRFHTKKSEATRKTQNSGVIVTAETRSFSSTRDNNPITGDITYHGTLTDIIELDYLFDKRVVLFKCDWVEQRGKKKRERLYAY